MDENVTPTMLTTAAAATTTNVMCRHFKLFRCWFIAMSCCWQRPSSMHQLSFRRIIQWTFELINYKKIIYYLKFNIYFSIIQRLKKKQKHIGTPPRPTCRRSCGCVGIEDRARHKRHKIRSWARWRRRHECASSSLRPWHTPWRSRRARGFGSRRAGWRGRDVWSSLPPRRCASRTSDCRPPLWQLCRLSWGLLWRSIPPFPWTATGWPFQNDLSPKLLCIWNDRWWVCPLWISSRPAWEAAPRSAAGEAWA